MPDGEYREFHGRRRRFSFIPAGILIGLGAGLLVGHPGPGALIGLGLGFFASGILQPAGAGGPEAAGAQIRWGFVLAGIILVLLGIGIVYSPGFTWPYLIAVFLILLGIWFFVRSAFRA
ncbi:MAG: hypothetical protein LUQ40_03945 [Methanomicrobiales archaeon]|nr:hypothetical protein [Methanomicrobiales archaeon]